MLTATPWGLAESQCTAVRPTPVRTYVREMPQGCMLYWGEGSKKRNSVQFTNSDADMLELFLRFLRQCYGVLDERVAFSVNCFTHDARRRRGHRRVVAAPPPASTRLRPCSDDQSRFASVARAPRRVRRNRNPVVPFVINDSSSGTGKDGVRVHCS